MKKLTNSFMLLLLLATTTGILFSGCKEEVVTPDPDPEPFEIWVTDQTLNTITVFDGATMIEKEVIDIALAGGSKPHMLLFSPDFSFAYVACTGGDGATIVIRTSDYKVITNLPTGGSSHASIPSWDGSRVWVAAIAERKLREFTVDAASETFTITRELDLEAALPDPVDFPGNKKPICHMFTFDDSACYVTLGGGGLAVVDVATMTLTKAFTAAEIASNGCGLINGPAGTDIMYANSGTSTTSNFYLFNSKTHELMNSIDTGPDGKDAHGVAITPDGKELWMLNRHSDNIRIFDMATQQFTATIDNVGDAPDLIVFSPDGTQAFLTLRGDAATGPHANSGITPGVSIIDVATRQPIRIVQFGPADTSDPHGIALFPGR